MSALKVMGIAQQTSGVTEMSDLMSVEWEKWLEQEKSNYQAMEKQLADLTNGHVVAGVFQYREFWAHANEVAEKIKTITPLPEDDRERLQEEFQRICRDVKRRQAEERDSRRAESRQRRETIERKIAEARSCAESAPEDMKSLNKAQALLGEALAMLKEGTPQKADPAKEDSAAPTPAEVAPAGGGLLREDRQACWDKWRQANDFVFGKRQAIWNRDYEEVIPKVKEAVAEASEGDSFHALDKIKEVQALLKKAHLSKTQREEIRGMLNGAWETAIGKVNAVRDEKRRKYEEWLSRMEANLQRWTEELGKNKEMEAQLEAEMAQIKEQIQTAKSREVTDALREQLSQNRQKIASLGRLNKQLEEKIEAVKAKIGNN